VSKLNYFDIYIIVLKGEEWHKIFLGNSWISLLENTRDSKEGWMSHIFHKSKMDNIIVGQHMSFNIYIYIYIYISLIYILKKTNEPLILFKFQIILALDACQITIFNIITYVSLLVKICQKNETKNSKFKKRWIVRFLVAKSGGKKKQSPYSYTWFSSCN
jgi:hypothetical protein